MNSKEPRGGITWTLLFMYIAINKHGLLNLMYIFIAEMLLLIINLLGARVTHIRIISITNSSIVPIENIDQKEIFAT